MFYEGYLSASVDSVLLMDKENRYCIPEEIGKKDIYKLIEADMDKQLKSSSNAEVPYLVEISLSVHFSCK